MKVALANLRHPRTPEESVVLTTDAIAAAGEQGAAIVCFPECFVPGYRGMGKQIAPPDAVFLGRAQATVAEAAARANVGVILGTERIAGDRLIATALVVGRDGRVAGFQDKVQIDPSEEGTYWPGEERRVFQSGDVRFGIVICHEGWRYPETARAAVRAGAQIVFHPHLHEAEPGGYRPLQFADPANTFHEKAALCRAAENTCFFATVNCASEGSPTTSAVISPDGTVLAWQPYGREGLLLAEVDLSQATRLLATRLQASSARSSG